MRWMDVSVQVEGSVCTAREQSALLCRDVKVDKQEE